MAIARVGSITQADALASNTITTSVVVGAGSDLVLVARVHVEDATITISSVVWNGAPLSLLDVTFGTAWTRTAIYILKAPTPATGNLVTTLSAATHIKHSSEVLSGVDQTTTNRTTQKTQSNSATSTTLTVPSVVTGDYVVDAVTLDSTGHSYVQGASQNQDYNAAYQSAGDAVAANQAGVDGGVMSGSWTTACPFSHVATAFIPVDAGGAAGPKLHVVQSNLRW